MPGFSIGRLCTGTPRLGGGVIPRRSDRGDRSSTGPAAGSGYCRQAPLLLCGEASSCGAREACTVSGRGPSLLVSLAARATPSTGRPSPQMAPHLGQVNESTYVPAPTSPWINTGKSNPLASSFLWFRPQPSVLVYRLCVSVPLPGSATRAEEGRGERRPAASRRGRACSRSRSSPPACSLARRWHWTGLHLDPFSPDASCSTGMSVEAVRTRLTRLASYDPCPIGPTTRRGR